MASKSSKAEIGVVAYSKMMLHAAKYPTQAINGVLLGSISGSTVAITDAIPLFHSTLNLSPMLEVALLQLEVHCKENKLVIAGYYQANATIDFSGMDSTASAISTKIRKQCPESIVVIINNNGFSLENFSATKAVNVFFPQGDRWVAWSDSGGDGKHTVEFKPSDVAVAKSVTSLIASKPAFADFDNYLDDTTLSFLNKGIAEGL